MSPHKERGKDQRRNLHSPRVSEAVSDFPCCSINRSEVFVVGVGGGGGEKSVIWCWLGAELQQSPSQTGRNATGPRAVRWEKTQQVENGGSEVWFSVRKGGDFPALHVASSQIWLASYFTSLRGSLDLPPAPLLPCLTAHIHRSRFLSCAAAATTLRVWGSYTHCVSNPCSTFSLIPFI